MRNTLLALAAALCAACATGREAVQVHAPELLPQFDALISREKALQEQIPVLEQAVEAAVASPDPADDVPAAEALAAANQELQSVEAQIAPIEERTIRNQAEPFSPLLPYGLGALAIEAVVAISSKRKRQLYASAFRQLTKGQLLTSAGEILKALGAKHSSPPPEPPKA